MGQTWAAFDGERKKEDGNGEDNNIPVWNTQKIKLKTEVNQATTNKSKVRVYAFCFPKSSTWRNWSNRSKIKRWYV